MRRLLAIASVLVIGAFTTASATAARQGPVIAHVAGTQEVIPVGTSTPGTSMATGLATFRLSQGGQALSYRLSISHLSGIFHAHIHVNGAGVNGPVVVFLFKSAQPTGEVNGLLAQGTISASDFVGPLFGHPFSELLTDIRNGDAYVNVHTLPNHPGGEIRGRVLADAGGDKGFAAHLTGTQEVITTGTSAPGTSLGTGLATFRLSEDGQSLRYRLSVFHITGVFQAHIHLNGAGVNGPVVVFLFKSAQPTGEVNGLLSEGTITAADFVCPLFGHPFSELLTDIRNGDAYVNVHTLPNHPGGEIRGRVLADAGGDKGFAAHLTGTQEVITTGTSAPGTSLGTGLATFRLSEDGQSLRYRLSVFHITGVFQAHIHLNGAGVNGPVVAFLFKSATPTGEVDGLLSEGTITADSLVGPLFGHPFSELLTDIRSGDAYVNVHTLPNHPGGEIRGQVVSGEEGFKASLTGSRESITSDSSTPWTSLGTDRAVCS